MASRVSTGSPRASRKTTPTMKVFDDAADMIKTPRIQTKKSINAVPLQTNNLANLQPNYAPSKDASNRLDFDDMLDRLRMNDSRNPDFKVDDRGLNEQQASDIEKNVMNVTDRPTILKRQELDMKTDSDLSSAPEADMSSVSDLYTPATENFDDLSQVEVSEIQRVKQELETARSVISRQQQELDETRSFKHTMDQAMGPASETDYTGLDSAVSNMQSAFNASAHPFASKSNAWSNNNNQFELSSNSFPITSGRTRVDQFGTNQSLSFSNNSYGQTRDTKLHLPDYAAIYGSQRSPVDSSFAGHRALSDGSSTFPLGIGQGFHDDLTQSNRGETTRNIGYLRPEANIGGVAAATEMHSPIGSFIPSSLQPIGSLNVSNNSQQYLQTRAMNIAASPFGEVPFGTGSSMNLGYVTAGQNQTYVTPLEPMNYRRLLDKSVSCDWKYIVDKIVCNNDQQASIFLQQKLKVGTAEQKFEIVDSIINQAYPLMINRFGNFLVQRCFEHGTPDQVVAIANAIHGNVTSLSMDPFGCHVVQKAFDSVPESHKADMVRELLRRIPDTVIHRYACHVWQKLFELRWSGEPPQIMIKVNEALRRMWHEVALGETGSLVVQNIFENCIEEEKRPAIEEVITNIDLIAHGQFGNWCIQHLCEHGSPPDKRRVIDHILKNAYSYSIDQYASKVVEKCLKIGGLDFLDRYLDVITTSHPDRPRIPLIDIAGDQYGNYLIQWILMNTHQHQREQVAIHIRKHMVSLRGSKFGSRVAMLCCNPASVTRPGPGALVNPYGAPGQPRSQWSRLR